jgi:hypothetical protein
MQHALQCQCGHVRGQLKHIEKTTHLLCYCKDCQAFAHFLGRAADVLDAQGGSHIVVTHPREIAIDSGAEAIACMSLSGQGMLRWYASCCNTPLGNTSRNHKVAYVGLASACLAEPGALERDFGPVRMRSGTESAKGVVAGSGLAALPLMLGFGAALLRARLSGSYRHNPFFKIGTDQPVAQPTVLADAERERLKSL